MLSLGLMSGTSLDGVDAVLVSDEADGAPARVLGHHHHPFTASLREELLALNQSGPDELHRAALCSNALAQVYAQAITELLSPLGVATDAVRVVGAHGQTVRHRPGEFDGFGYTLQLLNGALLAELCGIDVVCDFRSRDVAAHGQGAPLVPAFHAARFGRPGLATAVLNLGGIGNLSLLHADGRVGGFDCGPGNVLMDLWCAQHRGEPFDRGGAWAACGTVDGRLLSVLLEEPYLRRHPPKSTGRDLFHAGWLEARLALVPDAVARPADVQATLAAFTARTAAQALESALPDATTLMVCGGGALNAHLMTSLQALMPQRPVRSTADAGLPPLQVEAAAFAWLAQAFVNRVPGNRPEVTGSDGLRVLGALHPAGPRGAGVTA